jgi:WD40 repeat protein
MERSLRVFLSHTSEFTCFPQGRSFVALAKDAIRKAGHAAVDMSDFPAYPDSPAELCRKRVTSCDVYVGLLGFRYGSLVPDEQTISYTELEFTAASRMPRLAFLLTEDAALDLPRDEDERQRTFRARVANSGITVKFIDSVDELELEIYRALTESVHQPTDPGPAYRPPVTGREVPRPELFEPLVHQLVSEDQSVGLVSARLEGAGGFGKTTLAVLACADPRVRARFLERDFWVTLGEHVHGAELLAKVNDLIVTVSGTRQPFTDLEQASQHLGRLVNSARTLLVIDDVWHPSQLTPFLAGNCTRLIISRVRDLLPWGPEAINVDVMTEEQARDLLGNGLPGAAEADWSTLMRRAGGCALQLKLINHAVRYWVKDHGQSLGSAIRRVEAKFTSEGPTALDPDDPKYRQEAFTTTVRVSVRLLSEAHPQWPERFTELAVFPKNTSIPLATLATYWQDSMTCDEAEALCVRLANLSLVQHFELTDTRSLRLHDVIHDHLVHSAGERLPELHKRLLDTHAPTQWWELPADEPYLWDHLTYHLGQIMNGGADNLVCDLRWIEARLRRNDRFMIDIDFAHTTSDHAFRLREALIRSMHLFSPLEPAPSLAATLASRLHGIEGLTEIVERYEHSRRGYWLAPVWPLPDQPSPAFRGTFATGTSGVCSFVVSRDGTWMATGHEDGTVSTWDLPEGRILSSARLHEHRVRAIDITADGGLVSTSLRGVAWQQDPKRSAKNRYYLHYEAAWDDVAADPVRPRVAICGPTEQGVQFFDHKGLPQRLRTPWPRMVMDFLFGTRDRGKNDHFYPDSSRDGIAPIVVLFLILIFLPWPANLIAAFCDAVVVIIGVTFLRLELHCRRPRNLTDYRSYVYGVSFSPEGTLLATGSFDGTVRLWDAVNGRLKATFPGSKALIGSVAIDVSNQWLASATNDGMFRLWNIHTGELQVAEPITSERGAFYSVVCFSAEGTWVASSIDSRVTVWAVQDGALRASLTSLAGLVSCVGFTQDARLLLTVEGSSVRKWELADLLDELSPRSDDLMVRSVAFSADGSWLAIGGPENKISIRAADGTPRTTMIAPTRTVHAVAIAPDGRWLASGDNDGAVRLWNLDGTLRATLTGHTERVFAVAIAPDSSWLASGGADNTIRIWSAEGTLRTTLTGHTGDDDHSYAQGIYGLAIAEDGTWLASASSDGTVRSWDTKTWDATVLEDHDDCDEDERNRNIMGLQGVAISPDGSWVASAGWDNYIRMRSVRDGELRALRAHNSHVKAVSFSPDGTQLASVGINGVVRIWRVSQGECVAALRVDGNLCDCAWSPKSNLVAVGGSGGSYLFKLDSA